MELYCVNNLFRTETLTLNLRVRVSVLNKRVATATPLDVMHLLLQCVFSIINQLLNNVSANFTRLT